MCLLNRIVYVLYLGICSVRDSSLQLWGSMKGPCTSCHGPGLSQEILICVGV